MIEAFGEEKVRRALDEADRRLRGETRSGGDLRPAAEALELQVFVLLGEGRRAATKEPAAEAFRVMRVLPRPENPVRAGEELVRLGCLGLLGGLRDEVRAALKRLPSLPVNSADWDERVWARALQGWLWVLRGEGDAGVVLERLNEILGEDGWKEQIGYISAAMERGDRAAAARVAASRYTARAAVILLIGRPEDRYKTALAVGVELATAIHSAEHGQRIEREQVIRLLERVTAPPPLV